MNDSNFDSTVDFDRLRDMNVTDTMIRSIKESIGFAMDRLTEKNMGAIKDFDGRVAAAAEALKTIVYQVGE